jgi:hypothetical protein
MKLFNMASEVGQHAMNQGWLKDTLGNMQADPVIVGSKKRKRRHLRIHEKLISSIRSHRLNLLCCKYLCELVSHCVSEVGLIGRSLM